MKKIIISGIFATMFLPQMSFAIHHDGWESSGPTAQEIAAEKKRVAAEKKKKAAEAAAKAAREAQEIADSKARVQKEYEYITKSINEKIDALKNDWIEKIKELDKEVLTEDLVDSIKEELSDFVEELLHKKYESKEVKEESGLETSIHLQNKKSDSLATLKKTTPAEEVLNNAQVVFNRVIQVELRNVMGFSSHAENIQHGIETQSRQEIHALENKVNADIRVSKTGFDLDIVTSVDRWKRDPGVAEMVKELRDLLEEKIERMSI